MIVDRVGMDAEQLRRALPVAPRSLERPTTQRTTRLEINRDRDGLVPHDRGWQVGDPNPVGRRGCCLYAAPLHRTTQLPHVPRPVISQEPIEGLGLQHCRHAGAEFVSRTIEEMIGEGRDVQEPPSALRVATEEDLLETTSRSGLARTGRVDAFDQRRAPAVHLP